MSRYCTGLMPFHLPQAQECRTGSSLTLVLTYFRNILSAAKRFLTKIDNICKMYKKNHCYFGFVVLIYT